jgi:hypothetical protein
MSRAERWKARGERLAPALAAIVCCLALYLRYRLFLDGGGGSHPFVLSGHPLPGGGDLGLTILVASAAMLYGTVLNPWIALGTLCVLSLGALFLGGARWTFPAYGIAVLGGTALASRRAITGGRGFSVTVLWGMLTFFVGTVCVWLCDLLVSAGGVREGLLASAKQYEAVVEAQVETVSAAVPGSAKVTDAAAFVRSVLSGRGGLHWIPAYVIVWNAVVLLCAHGAGRLLLPAREAPFYRRRALSEVVLPGYLVWLFLGAVGTLFALVMAGSLLSALPSNLLVLVLALFSVQGIAVLSFWVRNAGGFLSRRGLRWLAVGVLFSVVAGLVLAPSLAVGSLLFGVAIPAVVAVGVFDTWFDYRGVDRPKA